MTIEIAVAQVIEKSRGQSVIKPSWVAGEVMKMLDPERLSPPAVYGGCNAHVRQVARSQLRQEFEPEDGAPPAQHELWPELQWRYPKAHSKAQEEPEYVLTDDMTPADVGYNVARLRAEGRAKLKHADALEEWHMNRRARRTAG